MRTDERTDADLVAAALAGDRGAVADIYDRYSTVIFTVCVRLLGNRDDAADCAAEVFLRATERLHQLREPEKLKPWLYAIARNEVARRQRKRGREVPVEAIDELPWAADDETWSGGVGEPELVGASTGAGGELVGASAGGSSGSFGELEQLLQEASAGLTDRDRAVAELGLRQNLQGDDLADALGVTTNHAYVLVHRVRGRLEKAITAILVARGGRDDCAELAKILAGWDGELTVLLRKRVSRHIDRCDICGARRKLVPAALFDAAPVLAAPIAVRHRVLSEAQVATAGGRPWSSDGFPRTGGGRRRSLWLTGVAAVLVVLALLAVVVAGGDDGSTVVAERSSVDQPSPRDPTTVPEDGPAGTAPTTTGDTIDLGGVAAGATTTTLPGSPSTTTGGLVFPPGPDGPDGPGEPEDPDGPVPPVSGSLVASPAVVDFGPLTTSQPLTLTNTGGTPLSYSLGGSTPALSIGPSSGQVGPGASVVVTVGLDRAGLGDTFAGSLDGQVAGGAISIPVLAVNSIAPTIIGTPSGPLQFGVLANAACAIDVEATDNTGVVEVEVIYTVPGAQEYRVLLAPAAGNHWRGQLLMPIPPPGGTGTWVVVVRDAIGNETPSSPRVATNGTTCIPAP